MEIIMFLVAVVVVILALYTANNIAYIRRHGREQVELLNAIAELLRGRGQKDGKAR